VCSDERGWTENPLVYCDGQGCTVAVHQGIYLIVNIYHKECSFLDVYLTFTKLYLLLYEYY